MAIQDTLFNATSSAKLFHDGSDKHVSRLSAILTGEMHPVNQAFGPARWSETMQSAA